MQYTYLRQHCMKLATHSLQFSDCRYHAVVVAGLWLPAGGCCARTITTGAAANHAAVVQAGIVVRTVLSTAYPRVSLGIIRYSILDEIDARKQDAVWRICRRLVYDVHRCRAWRMRHYDSNAAQPYIPCIPVWLTNCCRGNNSTARDPRHRQRLVEARLDRPSPNTPQSFKSKTAASNKPS